MKTDKKIEDESFINIVLKTFATTLGLVVVLLFISIFAIVAISPNTAAKMFDDVNSKTASYAVYKRMYEKSGDSTDLYNVLSHSVEIGNSKETEKYAKLMLSIEDADNFYNNIDKATKDALGEKQAVYVSSYKSYVQAVYVRALYKNNKIDDAKTNALIYLDNGNPDAVLEFVNLVNEDKLSDTQKDDILKGLSNDGVIAKLDAMLADPSLNTMNAVSNFDAAVIINTRIKINQAKYYIIKTIDIIEADKVQTTIKNLITSLTALTASME